MVRCVTALREDGDWHETEALTGIGFDSDSRELKIYGGFGPLRLDVERLEVAARLSSDVRYEVLRRRGPFGIERDTLVR